MKTYRSSVSLVILAVPILILGTAGYFLFQNASDSRGFAFIMLSTSIFIFILLFAIKYEIEGEFLTVYYGFGIRKKIRISDIRIIRKTFNPMSAPAASFKRLMISTIGYDQIMISPKNQSEFLDDLLAINPRINIIL